MEEYVLHNANTLGSHDDVITLNIFSYFSISST